MTKSNFNQIPHVQLNFPAVTPWLVLCCPIPSFKILLEEISSDYCINRTGNAGTRTRRRAVVMETEADEERPFINVHVRKF